MRDVFSLAVLRMNLGVQNNAERNLGDLHAIVVRLFDNNSSATSLSHARARQSVHDMKCRLFDDFVQSARVALGGFEMMRCVECQRRGIHCATTSRLRCTRRGQCDEAQHTSTYLQ